MASKVIFYPLTKTIKLKPGVRSLDFKVEVYSDGKEEWLADASLRKYIFPILTEGGKEVPGGKVIESTFFLRNGWQMEPASEDHEVTIYGNIFHDDGIPIVKVPSGYSIVVNLSTTISPDTTNPAVVKRASEDTVYGGRVTVDVTSSYSGVEYPVGTSSYPVNNVADAMTIAISRGFSGLNIVGNITLSSGDDLTDIKVFGQDQIHTTVTIESAAVVTNIIFYDCTVTGVLDGGSRLENCLVGNIDYVNGHIGSSGLYGSIVLAGSAPAVVANCYTIDQDSLPSIDMGGSGQDLSMPNYAGMISIDNLHSASEEIGIGLNAGMVTLASGITAGTIIVSGIGLLVDNSVGTATVNVDGLVNNHAVAYAVWKEPLAQHTTISGSAAYALDVVRKIETNRWKIESNQFKIYDDDGISILYTFNLKDSGGSPTEDEPKERDPV